MFTLLSICISLSLLIRSIYIYIYVHAHFAAWLRNTPYIMYLGSPCHLRQTIQLASSKPHWALWGAAGDNDYETPFCPVGFWEHKQRALIRSLWHFPGRCRWNVGGSGGPLCPNSRSLVFGAPHLASVLLDAYKQFWFMCVYLHKDAWPRYMNTYTHACNPCLTQISTYMNQNHDRPVAASV